MKLICRILCLVLLIGVNSSSPFSATENKGQPVDMSYICLQTTSHGNNKPPILLLHGLFGFKETWYGLMTLLTINTGRKVCAADSRNNGESPWSDEFNTVVLAKDVERLLETLNVEKVIILGHSLGGKTAVEFTINNPEKVEKLIVEDMRPNSYSHNPIRKTSLLKDLAEAALKAIPEGATELEAKRAVYKHFEDWSVQIGDPFCWDDAAIRSIPIKCLNGKCTWKANIDVLDRAMNDPNGTKPYTYGQFNGPTLFIYGGKSVGKVGDAKEEILQLFPNADLVEIKNAGHQVHTFPEYKDEVLKFILK